MHCVHYTFVQSNLNVSLVYKSSASNFGAHLEGLSICGQENLGIGQHTIINYKFNT